MTAAGWLEVYPQARKTEENTVEAFNRWAGETRTIGFHSDNAPELIAAARRLGWRRTTSAPGTPQTNGIAERMVRKVKEGTRAALIQSGLDPSWWRFASRHYTLCRNIVVRDGDSCYHRRRKKGHFNGLHVPYGALVEYMPQPESRPATFKPQMKFGLFLAYHVLPGGWWSGDYYVAELGPFQASIDASRRGVKVHRVKEVSIPNGASFDFPVARRRSELDRQVKDPQQLPPKGGAHAPTNVANEVEVNPVPRVQIGGASSSGGDRMAHVEPVPTTECCRGPTRPSLRGNGSQNTAIHRHLSSPKHSP